MEVRLYTLHWIVIYLPFELPRTAFCQVTPGQQFADSHLNSWVVRDTVRVILVIHDSQVLVKLRGVTFLGGGGEGG